MLLWHEACISSRASRRPGGMHFQQSSRLVPPLNSPWRHAFPAETAAGATPQCHHPDVHWAQQANCQRRQAPRYHTAFSPPASQPASQIVKPTAPHIRSPVGGVGAAAAGTAPTGVSGAGLGCCLGDITPALAPAARMGAPCNQSPWCVTQEKIQMLFVSGLTLPPPGSNAGERGAAQSAGHCSHSSRPTDLKNKYINVTPQPVA